MTNFTPSQKLTHVRLSRAANGGWIVQDDHDCGRFPVVVAAFSSLEDMIASLPSILQDDEQSKGGDA